MKIKGFDRAIVFQLNGVIEKALQGSETIKHVHRGIMLSRLSSPDAMVHFAKNVLSKILEEFAVEDPIASCYSQMGFAPFTIGDDEEFAIAIPGTNAYLARIEKRERVLPAISVNRELQKRMAELVKKELDGWVPTKKDWAQLKDEVLAEMLAHAPIRPTSINLIFNGGFLYVMTSSSKVAEDCNAIIRKAFGTWGVIYALNHDYRLRDYMKAVALSGIEHTIPGSFAHLKHDDGEDVKLKDIDIRGNETVNELINDFFTVRALDIELKTDTALGDIGFRLSDKGILTAIDIGDPDIDANYDATLEQYGNDSGKFLTMMANLFHFVKSMEYVTSKLNVDDALHEGATAVMEMLDELVEEEDEEV